jgi:uncharacterized membrane protein
MRYFFFLCLFLYDCFFVYHLIIYYSNKAADDLTYQPAYGFPQHRLPLGHPLWVVYAHASCSIPLVLGNLQFLPILREHSLWLHKCLGWTYVVIYVLGAIGAFYMTCFMHCSIYLKAATWVLGIAWAGSTVFAVCAVRSKQIELHRQWMARSFLLSHTIPLLFRFLWILAVVRFGIPEVPAFEYCGWIIVVMTVPLAESMASLEAGNHFTLIYSAKSYELKTKAI